MTSRKSIEQLEFFDACHYFHEHTWITSETGVYRIGISDYAQDQLGEIIFVELPRPGDNFRQGNVFGFVESVKTASDLYMPVDAQVVAVNEELEDSPELINTSPYSGGWMIEVKVADAESLRELMSAAEYKASLG